MGMLIVAVGEEMEGRVWKVGQQDYQLVQG